MSRTQFIAGILVFLMLAGCATYDYRARKMKETEKAHQLYLMMEKEKIGKILVMAKSEKSNYEYKPFWFWPPSWSEWKKEEVEEERKERVKRAIARCLREEEHNWPVPNSTIRLLVYAKIS